MSMKRVALGLALSWITTAAMAADSLDMLPFALMGGTPSLDLRVRAEHADNTSSTQVRDSTATTLRGRLAITTGKWNDFDASAEYEGVTAYDKLDYNNNTAASTQTQRPAVADPAGSELNQAWIRYAGIPKTTLQGGRVRFVLDNHRWVGNVGWRQNEQTYDGAVVQSKPLAGTELTYAYFHNANSILFTNFPMRTNLANFSYSPGAWLKGTVYSYWIDFEAANVGNRQDSQTQGVRFAGAPELTDTLKLLYTAEYARQHPFEESNPDADADYWLGEAGATVATTTLKLGYEVMGSNAGLYSVQTPLATLHAHDGWADLFLVTPPNGLVDQYVSLASTLGATTLAAAAHRFEGDYLGADYGDEYDASIAYAFNRQFAGLVKYAYYNATNANGAATSFAGNFDTEKGWLQLEYKF